MQSIVVSALFYRILCSLLKTDFRCVYIVLLLTALSVVIVKSLFLILHVLRTLSTRCISVASVCNSFICLNFNKILL